MEDRRLDWPSPELFTWSVLCTNLQSALRQMGEVLNKLLVCRKWFFNTVAVQILSR